MKVKITQTEVQYFEITKEIEITKEEYKVYLKSGVVSKYIINELCSETGNKHWIATEITNTTISK